MHYLSWPNPMGFRHKKGAKNVLKPANRVRAVTAMNVTVTKINTDIAA